MLEFVAGAVAVVAAYSLWAVFAMSMLKRNIRWALNDLTGSAKETEFLVSTFWDEIVLANARNHSPDYTAHTIARAADAVIGAADAGSINLTRKDMRLAVKDTIRDVLGLPSLSK